MGSGHLIVFDNPVFPPVGELFVTVRRGNKWGKWGGYAEVGDILYLADNAQPADIHGSAELVARTDLGPARDIPKSWLKREHDEKCRTLDGLSEELKACYNGFEDGDDVVALLLLRVR